MPNHPARKEGPFSCLAEQAEVLSRMRAQAGATQTECAVMTLAGEQTWRQWERGERRMPAAAMELWCLALAIPGPGVAGIKPGAWMDRWVRVRFVAVARLVWSM